MATLYQLTDDYLTLLELAEDPDIDEQALKDTMEGIEGALEIKAEGYAKIIRMLEGDAAACDAENKASPQQEAGYRAEYRPHEKGASVRHADNGQDQIQDTALFLQHPEEHAIRRDG